MNLLRKWRMALVPVTAAFSFAVTKKRLVHVGVEPLFLPTRPSKETALAFALSVSTTCDEVDDLLNECCSFASSSFPIKRKSILERIQQRHMADCQESANGPFAFESVNKGRFGVSVHVAPYELIYAAPTSENSSINHGRFLAVRSNNDHPLLNSSTVVTIRQAADSYWKASKKHQTSRFTFQRPGNYEAHISDLGNATVIAAINEALVHAIYPLVRKVFWKHGVNGDTSEMYGLCIYDALIVRYNATEAAIFSTADSTHTRSNIGCSQPFHRDLGLVTVNVMLNDPTEFEGGGTFFENQLLPTLTSEQNGSNLLEPPEALKPVGTGHFLAHLSSERHAASATVKGVRDILVIFVTARPLLTEQQQNHLPPASIQGGMLKQCRVFCEQEQCTKSAIESIACRVTHQRLAVDACPNDGEAWQYLGIAIMEYSDCKQDTKEKEKFLSVAKRCLEQAALLTPCDARVFHHLGLVLKRLAISRPTDPLLHASIENAFSQSLKILSWEESAGCDVSHDMDGLVLNFGLYLSYQDRYREASQLLERITVKNAALVDSGSNRIVNDAHTLWQYCQRQLLDH